MVKGISHEIPILALQVRVLLGAPITHTLPLLEVALIAVFL